MKKNSPPVYPAPYLRNRSNGRIFPYHELLAKRADMDLYTPPEPAKAVETKSVGPAPTPYEPPTDALTMTNDEVMARAVSRPARSPKRANLPSIDLNGADAE